MIDRNPAALPHALSAVKGHLKPGSVKAAEVSYSWSGGQEVSDQGTSRFSVWRKSAPHRPSNDGRG